jgi:hypothetical protein
MYICLLTAKSATFKFRLYVVRTKIHNIYTYKRQQKRGMYIMTVFNCHYIIITTNLKDLQQYIQCLESTTVIYWKIYSIT